MSSALAPSPTTEKSALEKFMEVLGNIRAAAGAESFNIARRSRWFADIADMDILEERMQDMDESLIVGKYKEIMGGQ